MSFQYLPFELSTKYYKPITSIEATNRSTIQVFLKCTPYKALLSVKMSYLFGGGRPQPSSAEKLAAAETEVEMVSDMLNRYAFPPRSSLLTIYLHPSSFLFCPFIVNPANTTFCTASSSPARKNAYLPTIANRISTRGSRYAWTDACRSSLM